MKQNIVKNVLFLPYFEDKPTNQLGVFYSIIIEGRSYEILHETKGVKKYGKDRAK